MPATYGIVTAGAFIQNGVKMLREVEIFLMDQLTMELPMVSLEKSAEYSRTVLTKNDHCPAWLVIPVHRQKSRMN